MKTRHQSSTGFTLLELIVVIVVIGILAGLTAPSLFRHVSDARIVAAKADLATISLALETYALTVGDYPSTSDGLRALFERPTGGSPRWRGPYLRGAVPLDPWGNAYRYEFPGSEPTSPYELRSLGRDGKPGGTGEDADIASGEPRAQ